MVLRYIYIYIYKLCGKNQRRRRRTKIDDHIDFKYTTHNYVSLATNIDLVLKFAIAVQ